MIFNVIIEIPKHSNIKYEYDRFSKKIIIDRKLDEKDVYPQAYGFIPNTLDWDGDELDVLVFSNRTFKPGATTQVKLIGAMDMVDDGETDTKLLAIDINDLKYKNIENLSQIDKKLLHQIQFFFQTYKRFKNKIVIVREFKDIEWAKKEYETCVDLMKQYGSLSKKAFLDQMKKLHPEKYIV